MMSSQVADQFGLVDESMGFCRGRGVNGVWAERKVPSVYDWGLGWEEGALGI